MSQSKESILNQLTQLLPMSHSPYSKVQVAAAVTYQKAGETCIAYGVNVENVSYGLTVCAERSAISAAIADGMTSIDSLYVMSNQSKAISPCGACRQVLGEFTSKASGPVLCINSKLDDTWESSLDALLPNRFEL
jgi:cytidine deaminase